MPPDDDADEDLKLNTLDRFAKKSALILHEYSHCEVPAGCGGVVLRWIHPAMGRPSTLLLTNARGIVFLDGKPVEASTIFLGTGGHVVGLALEASAQPWTLELAYDERGATDLITNGRAEWRGTNAEPPADWMAPSFDARGWELLPEIDEDDLVPLGAPDRYPRRGLETALSEGRRVVPHARFVRITFYVPEIK